MLFSDTVVRELAKVWTRLHGAAAPTHIEYLIAQAELSGDADGAANHRRVRALLGAYEERRRLPCDGSARKDAPNAFAAAAGIMRPAAGQ